MKKYDIVVIGAGVAGMTAAIYGLRAKKSVLVLEKAAVGGQILYTNKIENYPGFMAISGKDLAKSLKTQVKSFGGTIVAAEALDVAKKDDGFELKTDDETVFGKTIIIANGSTERRLGIDNEEGFISKGISYCATCDGALFKDKTVAVYGGGNSSAYSAMYLAGMCKNVYWIFRKPEPRAERQLVEKVREVKNITVLPSRIIDALEGNEKLSSIRLKSSDSGKTSSLELDGLFVTIGREPNNALFKDLVKLDDGGYIVADETCMTSTPGLFVAGDTRAKKLHQIVTATADGAIAASAAIEYINERTKNV